MSGPANGGRPAPGPRDGSLDAIAWLAVAGVAIGLLGRMLPLGGIDFQQVWLAAGSGRNSAGVRQFYAPQARDAVAAVMRQRAADGDLGPRELAATKTNFDIGREADRQVVLPTATPFLYACFSLFGTACGWNFEWAVVLYRTLATAAGGFATWLALRHHRLAAAEAASLVTVFGLLPECVVSDLRVANVSLIHYLLLAIACTTMQGRHGLAPLAGGVCLGLALAFKPSVFGALPAVCLLAAGERRWGFLVQALGGAAVGVAAAWLVGAGWAGSAAVWNAWLANVREMAEPGRMFAARVRDGNFAGMQVCAELWGTRPRLTAAIAIGTCWLLAVARRMALPRPCDAAFRSHLTPAVFAGVASGFFLSDLAWLHYYVFLLPVIADPLIRVLRGGLGWASPDRPDVRRAIGVAACGVAGVGLYGVPLAGIVKASALTVAVVSNGIWLAATGAVIWMLANPEWNAD